MAISPNILAVSAKRSIGARRAAQAARRGAAAGKFKGSDDSIRDPYGFLAIPLDESENVGGPWNPGIAMDALQAAKTDVGWGGWSDRSTPPWGGSQEAEMIGSGGIEVNDRRRETIAAQHYMSAVGGDLNMRTGGDCKVTVKHDRLTMMDTGKDSIRVQGDAVWRTEERMVLGACNVERRWEGAILRMIGMEGIICGGFFMKTFSGGIFTTMSPLVSGDVYGGAVHASAIRFRACGGMAYRSSELAWWWATTYLRKAWTTIEPMPGSLQQDAKRPLYEKVGRCLMGTNPILDIMWGVTFMPMAIYSLVKTIKNLIQKKKSPAEPPQGLPRTRTRVVDNEVQTAVQFKL